MIYSDHRTKHGISWSIFHMQWVTKYRYKVFSDEKLKNLCIILLRECAERHHFILEDVEIQPEHVHVLVKLRPSQSPSQIVNFMKGYSSRLLFMLEHEKLSKWYYQKGERSLWGEGKFMGSVGHITLDKAKEYMNNQETHHAKSI